ncbi:hypothetical protein HS088_TW09G00445 [Tripterygium wilfordii]|uniref:Ycf3-interacting protein 1, chloroplastic n=1 Tax=Tripterygium wilfordii TaxID=458696 RepID=A0A7J7D7S1_TRIWF|nr:ycf3-interacting protein 1, chloroplastic [Tripterygium wilfordii]KAF5742397.1 hypothetical protein HS088_TW09G00445 [Tripterygium wilfordii]
MMALQLFQVPLAPSSKPKCIDYPNIRSSNFYHQHTPFLGLNLWSRRSNGVRSRGFELAAVDKNELLFGASPDKSVQDPNAQEEEDDEQEEEEEDAPPPTPQDLEYVREIRRVLELLKKNRDMIFSEVKLTITIEDPREVERRRLLGIDDADAPTRDDLAAVLEEVHEGKVPKDRIALRLLAEEMLNWPNLEVEVQKKKRTKSLYAKATDTGIDPQVAAKRLNVDWDSAAEIDDADADDETEVPPIVGYGALYLVTAFPVIIGISVVLILFYNSLQ